MHSLINNAAQLGIEENSSLMQFVKDTQSLDFLQRAQALEKANVIEQAHHSIATEGQTEAPSADDNVEYHFISFVHVDGHLYELDGAKKIPINHGASSADTFLSDAAKVIQKNFFEQAGDDVHFSVITLGPNQGDD
jgi:ubiquitin carboxyl-terminal hydrolase L3